MNMDKIIRNWLKWNSRLSLIYYFNKLQKQFSLLKNVILKAKSPVFHFDEQFDEHRSCVGVIGYV